MFFRRERIYPLRLFRDVGYIPPPQAVPLPLGKGGSPSLQMLTSFCRKRPLCRSVSGGHIGPPLQILYHKSYANQHSNLMQKHYKNMHHLRWVIVSTDLCVVPFRDVGYIPPPQAVPAPVAIINCSPLWLKICHWHIFLTRRAL